MLIDRPQDYTEREGTTYICPVRCRGCKGWYNVGCGHTLAHSKPTCSRDIVLKDPSIKITYPNLPDKYNLILDPSWPIRWYMGNGKYWMYISDNKEKENGMPDRDEPEMCAICESTKLIRERGPGDLIYTCEECEYEHQRKHEEGNRYKRVIIRRSLFILFWEWINKPETREFFITAPIIPEGCQVVDVHYDPVYASFTFTLKHKSFSPVGPGCMIPIIEMHRSHPIKITKVEIPDNNIAESNEQENWDEL